MAESLTLGVDIGGTKVAAGLVDARGQIVMRARRPMIAQKTADDALRAVLRAIEGVRSSNAAQSAKLGAVGLSAPGLVDPRSGTVISATNLPCWRAFPLAARIADATGLEVKLDNDGNAAALAEALWGAGIGYRTVFYVTMGTGIGTGLVMNGRVHHGRTGAAGEGGHMTIDYRGPLCKCGKRGCIEMYAAGPAIVARARKLLTSRAPARQRTRASAASIHISRRSKIMQLAGSIENITAEAVGQAALEGDALATQVLSETADRLAIWLGGVIDLLEPDVIVMGGGLAHLLANFTGRIRDELRRWSLNPRANEIPIANAMYGPASGIAGAAALCMSG